MRKKKKAEETEKGAWEDRRNGRKRRERFAISPRRKTLTWYSRISQVLPPAVTSVIGHLDLFPFPSAPQYRIQHSLLYNTDSTEEEEVSGPKGIGRPGASLRGAEFLEFIQPFFFPSRF